MSNYQEQRIIKLSLTSILIFIVTAFVFSLLTRSDAILFDGIYSLIGFCTSLMTLQVAKLAVKPDDDTFHFGYTILEPTLNLFKSLVMLVACCYAIMQGVSSLLTGGNPMAYGLAASYGLFASVGCFMTAWLMKRSNKEVNSGLVAVEIKTWFMDGLVSLSVFLGFALGWGLSQSQWSEYAPYVDPLTLIVIISLALPVPVKIMFDSFREVIAMAPPENIVEAIEQQVNESLAGVAFNETVVRVRKRGRNTYLLVHVVVKEDFKVNAIQELDTIRLECQNTLSSWNPEIVADILFTADSNIAQ